MKAIDFNELRKLWPQEVAYADYPEQQYHELLALSSGKMGQLLDSAAHFRSSMQAGYVNSTSPALRFGSIFHKAVLEGPEFLARYRVMPEFSGKGAKAAKAEWIEAHSGAIIIDSQEEMDQLSGMMESVMEHPVSSALLRGAENRKEITGLFNHEGFRCKLRADIWRSDDVVVDLKTTACASENEFMKSAWNFRYPIQAAWYLNGASKISKRPVRTFAYIAVEKTKPYPVAVYTASAVFLTAGEKMIQMGLKRLNHALDTGFFGGYSQQAQELQLPPWGIRDLEEMERVDETLYTA